MSRLLPRAKSFVIVCALSGAAACGGDKTEASDAGAASAVATTPVLGGKFGAAVAAAEASARAARAAPSGSAAAGEGGPPESGVFAPGRADKEVAPKSPPKVEVLTEGSEPRVQLAYATPDEQKAALTVTVRPSAQAMMPAIDVDVSVSLAKKDKDKKDKKDKGDKDKGDKKKDKADALEGAAYVAKFTRVEMGKEQAQFKKEAGDVIAKMKGTEIFFTLAPDGRIAVTKHSVPKEVPQELEPVLRSVEDTLTTVVAPLPSKPVGVGGSWMVSDRADVFRGVDVVRYRAYKVEKLDGQKATLSIQVREYAAQGELDAGGGQKAFIDAFDSQGKGTVEVTGPVPWPKDLQLTRQFRVGPAPGQGQQGIVFQFTVKGR